MQTDMHGKNNPEFIYIIIGPNLKCSYEVMVDSSVKMLA